MENPNIIASWLAPIIAALAGFLVARVSKTHDARSAAEAALIGSGPQIISEQTKRIGQLVTEVNQLWELLRASNDREAKCFASLHQLEQELNALKRGRNED